MAELAMWQDLLLQFSTILYLKYEITHCTVCIFDWKSSLFNDCCVDPKPSRRFCVDQDVICNLILLAWLLIIRLWRTLNNIYCKQKEIQYQLSYYLVDLEISRNKQSTQFFFLDSKEVGNFKQEIKWILVSSFWC